MDSSSNSDFSEGEFSNEESRPKQSKDENSEDDYMEDDIFDATFLAQVDEITEIQKYTEEDRGIPESR